MYKYSSMGALVTLVLVHTGQQVVGSVHSPHPAAYTVMETQTETQISLKTAAALANLTLQLKQENMSFMKNL